MGLGSLTTVSLAKARELASECRQLRLQGIDPIDHRNGVRAAARLDAAKAMTSTNAVMRTSPHTKLVGAMPSTAQWINTLGTYVDPGLWEASSADHRCRARYEGARADLEHEAGDGEPLTGRIERILDWAKARGYRSGENPARWRGHLDHLLPARSKVRKVKHHAALPFTEIAHSWPTFGSVMVSPRGRWSLPSSPPPEPARCWVRMGRDRPDDTHLDDSCRSHER